MQLCFDATRFGFGLVEAVELAAAKRLPAVEFSLEPFAASVRSSSRLSADEKRLLAEVKQVSGANSVEVALINLNLVVDCMGKGAARKYVPMVAKAATVAAAAGCRRLSLWLQSGSGSEWLAAAETLLSAAVTAADAAGVRLLLRLSTPVPFRGKPLSLWQPGDPHQWRDLLSAVPGLALSFSPADCLWQGIDYLRILPGFVAAIEHVEANDVEINQDLIADSGLFGPLWWRYRMAGKGQVDWPQLVEALKLYGYEAALSVHLDDEFLPSGESELGVSLDGSLRFLAALVKG